MRDGKKKEVGGEEHIDLLESLGVGLLDAGVDVQALSRIKKF